MKGDIWVLKGTRQIIENVHTQDKCIGQWCTIHNPVPGPWQDWEMALVQRGMFRFCPDHNIPHPAIEDVINGFTMGVHLCCGCPCYVAGIPIGDAI
jgi:hypothetical protein